MDIGVGQKAQRSMTVTQDTVRGSRNSRPTTTCYISISSSPAKRGSSDSWLRVA